MMLLYLYLAIVQVTSMKTRSRGPQNEAPSLAHDQGSHEDTIPGWTEKERQEAYSQIDPSWFKRHGRTEPIVGRRQLEEKLRKKYGTTSRLVPKAGTNDEPVTPEAIPNGDRVIPEAEAVTNDERVIYVYTTNELLATYRLRQTKEEIRQKHVDAQKPFWEKRRRNMKPQYDPPVDDDGSFLKFPTRGRAFEQECKKYGEEDARKRREEARSFFHNSLFSAEDSPEDSTETAPSIHTDDGPESSGSSNGR